MYLRECSYPSKKPDFRVYGFNSPSPQEGQEQYGYEFWATIPEDMKVSASYEEKIFDGGRYAVHCIKMGDFHEWRAFFEYKSGNSSLLDKTLLNRYNGFSEIVGKLWKSFL